MPNKIQARACNILPKSAWTAIDLRIRFCVGKWTSEPASFITWICALFPAVMFDIVQHASFLIDSLGLLSKCSKLCRAEQFNITWERERKRLILDCIQKMDMKIPGTLTLSKHEEGIINRFFPYLKSKEYAEKKQKAQGSKGENKIAVGLPEDKIKWEEMKRTKEAEKAA